MHEHGIAPGRVLAIGPRLYLKSSDFAYARADAIDEMEFPEYVRGCCAAGLCRVQQDAIARSASARKSLKRRALIYIASRLCLRKRVIAGAWCVPSGGRPSSRTFCDRKAR